MARQPRRLRAVVAASAAFALLAASCGDDSDDDTTDDDVEAGTEDGGGADGDVVPSGEITDISAMGGGPPSHIDPLLSTTVSASQINDSIYDGLTDINYSGDEPQAVGMAAESWEVNEDGDVWTFQIREGLTFSNDEPVLPSSFKHGWEIAACYGGNYSYLQGLIDGGQAMIDGDADEISGVVADDEAMTLEVTLAEPWGDFDFAAGFHQFAPMPEAREMPENCDDINPDDQTPWEDPGNEGMIGNGPFMLESWEGDYSQVAMVPNPNWDGTVYEDADLPNQPYLERVTFISADDLEPAYNEFEAGNADVATIPPGRYEEAEQNYQTYFDQPALGAYYFQINQRDERIGGEENYLLRRAILQAIDREDINSVVFQDTRGAATGITPEDIPGFQEGICEYCTYDPEGAEEDFEAWEAEGNSQDEPIPIQFNAGFGHEEVVDIVIENLGAVGIEAEPDPRDPDTYFDDLANGECVICRAGWLADYPTYDNFMVDLFHQSTLDDNNYGYMSDEFDELVDSARAEADPDAAAELYNEAENLLLDEDAGAVPINWYRSQTVTNPDRIGHLYERPDFHIEWETVQLAE